MRRYRDEPPDVVQKQHASYMSTLGPGLVTGASDDDPSGIGTYSQAGSAYGLGLAWLAVYLLPMMIAVQETVARIGTVTRPHDGSGCCELAYHLHMRRLRGVSVCACGCRGLLSARGCGSLAQIPDTKR